MRQSTSASPADRESGKREQERKEHSTAIGHQASERAEEAGTEGGESGEAPGTKERGAAKIPCGR